MRAPGIAIIENNVIALNSIREQLARALMAQGYRVTVLTSGPPEQLRLARERGFSVLDVGSSTDKPWEVARYLWRLFRGLRSVRPDACLTFTIRPAIWGNVVTGLMGIPTITNITGIGPLFERTDFAYRAARILYRFVLKRCARIFFQNHDDLEIFLEKGFARREVVERIPGSGVDHRRYRPRPRRRGEGPFRFLFVSRLVKDKGIVEYVEAASRLKSELPDTEFCVLGPVWRQNLKDNTVSEEELSGWVGEGIIRYLGESTDVRDFMAQCDCLVLPSYREGLSNVLLEASSMARPCITCDTTGCRDVVEHGVNGYLCRVRDAGDLAATMAQMRRLPEEERAAMGERGRAKVIREFDKETVIEAYLRAVSAVVAPRLPSTGRFAEGRDPKDGRFPRSVPSPEREKSTAEVTP